MPASKRDLKDRFPFRERWLWWIVPTTVLAMATVAATGEDQTRTGSSALPILARHDFEDVPPEGAPAGFSVGGDGQGQIKTTDQTTFRGERALQVSLPASGGMFARFPAVLAEESQQMLVTFRFRTERFCPGDQGFVEGGTYASFYLTARDREQRKIGQAHLMIPYNPVMEWTPAWMSLWPGRQAHSVTLEIHIGCGEKAFGGDVFMDEVMVRGLSVCSRNVRTGADPVQAYKLIHPRLVQPPLNNFGGTLQVVDDPAARYYPSVMRVDRAFPGGLVVPALLSRGLPAGLGLVRFWLKTNPARAPGPVAELIMRERGPAATRGAAHRVVESDQLRADRFTPVDVPILLLADNEAEMNVKQIDGASFVTDVAEFIPLIPLPETEVLPTFW